MINKMKKTAISVVISGGLIVASMSANAIVVGGIDFGTLGEDPSRLHFETATLAQTLIDGNGQTVTSYGQITTVNGATNYCGVAGDTNCGLYYVATFDNSAGFSESGGTAVSFNTAGINIYFANDPLGNLLTNPGGSPDNVLDISSLPLWATFNNHGNIVGTGTLIGANVLSGSTAGLYDVVSGGTVGDYLNANTVADGVGGFADIDITASFSNLRSRLNQFDTAVVNGSCFDGTAGEGDWCLGGTADIAGGTELPEPATLALLAVGLGMLGFSRRSKQA